MSPERLDRPAPKVALVTGGAGFVGSHLIRRIVEQFPETSVISIDNYFTGSVDNHVDDPRVQYITASCLGHQPGVGSPAPAVARRHVPPR